MNSESIAPGFFKCFGYLLLTGTLALSTASYSDHFDSKSGPADYKHTSHRGGLIVAAVFGPDDRLWRVMQDKKHVYIDYSTDFGKTFSAPVRINSESQRIKASTENRPGIAIDGSGRIFVIYTAEGTQPIAQYFIESINNGSVFSTPIPLSDKASEANSSHGRLALSDGGQAYVLWLDERDRTDWRQPGNAIYFAAIGGSGGANLVNRKLADTICECCRIAAAFDNEHQPILMARFIYPGNIRDHGLVRVRADGKPPLPWRVTFDQWRIEGCPEHGPAISISNDDRYHIAWFTQGSIRQGLFYASSSDHGEHFSNPLPFGNPEKLAGHPDVMAQGKKVILTWIEFDGNKTQLLIMQSNDAGQTWLPAQSIAESKARTDFPFLLASTQGVFVSWNSEKEGYRLIQVDPAIGLSMPK